MIKDTVFNHDIIDGYGPEMAQSILRTSMAGAELHMVLPIAKILRL